MVLKVDIVISPIRSKSDCIQIDRVFHKSFVFFIPQVERRLPLPHASMTCVYLFYLTDSENMIDVSQEFE